MLLLLEKSERRFSNSFLHKKPGLSKESHVCVNLTETSREDIPRFAKSGVGHILMYFFLRLPRLVEKGRSG